MQDFTFEELVEATMRLDPDLRQMLAQLLDSAPTAEVDEEALQQAEVLNEAGAYSVFMPLCDAHPHAPEATDAELLAAVQALSSEWEEEPI
jgi:hypothetical protein